MKLRYRIGDATKPVTNGESNAILHIVNDAGGWGRGFVLAISKRWAAPEQQYRDWSKRKWKGKDFVLGQIQPIWVENQTWVINMVAQRDYKTLEENGIDLKLPNVNYSSLYECLTRVRVWSDTNTSFHLPRIGSGLGKGDWNTIEKIINLVFENTPNEVYVYDFQQP